MTSLDESLAKGLANRFITEHARDATIAQGKMDALQCSVPRSGFTKQGRWQAFIRSLNEILRKSRLSQVEHGTRKREIVLVHYLGRPKINPATTWTERAIPINVLACTAAQGILPLTFSTRCYVGEHAFARIFQRLGLPDDRATDSGFYSIARQCAVEELSSLACWSVVYDRIFFDAYHSVYGEHPGSRETWQQFAALLTFVMPSKNGLFFADLSGALPVPNVRTFIHDRHLSARQHQLKSSLLEALTDDDRQMLECMNPAIHTSASFVAVNFVRTRLATFFDSWIATVLTKVNNVADADRLTKIFRASFEKNALDLTFVSLCEQLGHRTLDELVNRQDSGRSLSRLLQSVDFSRAQIQLNRAAH